MNAISNNDGAYPNGVGHSGSATSERAAKRIGGKRAQQVHDYVLSWMHRGVTCAETERDLKLGHGSASGALTRLHRSGHIVRLQREREGQQIYKRPDFVEEGEILAEYLPNVAYRDGYQRPMAIEFQPTPEQCEKIEALLRSKGATGYEAECFLHWLPDVVELLRGE